MLGAIAIVLGVSAAILLPDAIHRVDHFFATFQDDVNHNVGTMNRGLQSDVDRIDRQSPATSAGSSARTATTSTSSRSATTARSTS